MDELIFVGEKSCDVSKDRKKWKCLDCGVWNKFTKTCKCGLYAER